MESVIGTTSIDSVHAAQREHERHKRQQALSGAASSSATPSAAATAPAGHRIDLPGSDRASRAAEDREARRIERARRREAAWDDVPQRTKVSLLIMLAAVGGALVGLLEAALGHPVWLFALGLTAVVAGLLTLCHRWLWRPMDRLMKQLDQVRRRSQPQMVHRLPTARRDEIGQISRAFQQICIASIRDHHAARHLRRTLDTKVAAATRQATQRLRRLAQRDPLTDLGNRRFLEENLEPLIQSCRAAGQDLVAVAIDMDNFKPVNDTLGHAAGDELLIFLASLIRASIRREDYAVRVGGDEFLVLLPGCDLHRVIAFVERLTALFRQHARTALPMHLNAGISIGIASMQRDNLPDGKALLEQADANLYEAKRMGKGCAMGTN